MSVRKAEPDLVAYVTQDDVQTVVKRIPEEFRKRLRDVFIGWRSRGVRRLGSVRTRGRRDIDLYAVLPYRLSLGRFICRGQTAAEFGAPGRGQWPPWAVRRYLLYDVLLHELGHLQIIHPNSTNWKRKYASCPLANEFAATWRRRLWAQPFSHPDPVHNPPEPDELSLIPLWERLTKHQRFRLVDLAIRAPHPTLPDLAEFGNVSDSQRGFLSRALCYDSGVSNTALEACREFRADGGTTADCADGAD